MLGKTHALTGLLIGSLFTFIVTETVVFEISIIFIAVIGSLLPDIDSKNSYFGRKISVISWISKHRGFFHTLLFLGLLIIPLAIILDSILLYSFIAGFTSHLLLDALTKEGVRFFPGLKRLRGPIKTGSFSENILFTTELIALAYIIVI
ncbi:MAG: metal-dependent hydrolase [Nanobdellota archaeon]